MTTHKKLRAIKEVILANGSIHLSADPDISPESFLLKVGETLVSFEDCASETGLIDAITSESRFVLGEPEQATMSTPTEQKKGDIYSCWTNHLLDWCLSGTETIQLRINEPDLQCNIKLLPKLAVPPAAEARVLNLKIACHRARATLKVSCFDVMTGHTTVHDFEFDPEFRGGQAALGYQQVTLQMPPRHGGMEVSFSVDYKGYLDQGDGGEPFIFLTDIIEQPRNTAAAKLIPTRIGSDNEAVGGRWMQAVVPSYLSNQEAVSVVQGNTQLVVFEPKPNKLTMTNCYGHTIMLRADIPTQTLIYVNGSPVGAANVGTNDTPFRIPSQHLLGRQAHIAMKDLSGMQVFDERLVVLPKTTTPNEIMQRETPPPYDFANFAQTMDRYESMRLQMANGSKKPNYEMLAHALAVLERGHDRVSFKPLSFPKVAKPDVSIVIPVHNKVEVTYLALCSLLLAHNECSFEVIIVDDASTDKTTELEELVSGVKIIRNAEALRFIGACNAGAKQARGEYIALLNNDVEVTSGWLDNLLDAFQRFPNVGLVGSKLLYPDGRLQDAGGIVWGSGNPWNYGNAQNPNHPNFCYSRQVDYLSGAAMMTSRDIWTELEGLSTYLQPMYFEDTDFAFKVRDAGYTTYYVPSSKVFHYEGMTSGTDVTSGFKKFQEVNRPKFKRQWVDAYRGFGKEGVRPDLEKDRGITGRVLFVDYATPRPDHDAGSYAAIQEMLLVQSLGYKVTFVATNMAHFGSYTTELGKMGVEVIYAPYYMTLAEYLEQHAADFDAFYITRYYVAEEVLNLIRKYAPDKKVLFNNADLHFLRQFRAARTENDAGLMAEAKQTRDNELAVIEKVDVILSYTEVEHSVIEASVSGDVTVVRCPWVVQVTDDCPGLENRKGISFLGGFSHHPNLEGVKWFANEVMPLVESEDTSLVLSIYGSKMNDEVRALQRAQIDPIGFVEDPSDAYDRHRVFVAPLLSGAGIKGKVLGALANGLPSVLSPVAAEGIGLRSGLDCFIAEKPADWAKAIHLLNNDDDIWREMSANALNYIGECYSFEKGREKMKTAFEAAELF